MYPTPGTGKILFANASKIIRNWFLTPKPDIFKTISKLFTNIDFRQIWNFDVKGAGWVGLELSVLLTQTVARFDIWVTPYTDILILAKLRYFMSKDLSTKTV